jgi:DnaJ-class molecular chaperone
MGFRLSTCVIVGSLIDALRKAACGACDGEGILQVITIDGVGFTTQICRACDGSGRDPNAPPTIRETVLRSE